MQFSILILLAVFDSAFAAEACDHPKEPVKVLEYADIKNHDPVEQFIRNQVKYLCPVENSKHIENLRKTPPQFWYELEHCLFHKPFDKGDKPECLDEAKPIFVPFQEENKPKRCGTKTQILYNMGYYYCGNENTLQKFENEEIQQNPALLNDFIQNMRIYDVCYDTDDNKTIWTRHTIQHPGIFSDTVDKREEYCVKDIRTDPFFTGTDVFEKLKRKYEEENKKKKLLKGHKIVPQYLVPPQHLALKMWKKTANHYINTAPIRQGLIPLMTAIDEGIKRAGQKIYYRDEKKINDLLIFTKVVTQTSITSALKKLFRMKTSESRIWYKVVYSYTTKKVLTIIIHDTSDKLKKIKCKGATCDFQNWTENKDVKKGIGSDKLKHAYCCKFSAKEINEIFSFDLPSEGAASEACDIRNEALYINDPGTETGNETETPVCPIKFKDDIQDDEEKPTHYKELNYCLFKEAVPEKGSRLCNREPKPVLYIVKDEHNKPVRCGSKKDQFLHNFGFFYCQLMNEEQLRDRDMSKLNVIYDKILISYVVTYTVCYNISTSKTIWTRHQVLSIFKDPYFIEEAYCLKELSTEPFYENSKTYFQSLEKDFYNERMDQTIAYPMVPQRLVPDKHFALRTWKKTTNHYINVAPIWKYLVLLMTAIDEGLYRASINVQFNAFRSKTPHDGLIFYTRTKSAISLTERVFLWFSKPDRFESSIWYKFVYDPMTQQGVMIHVRNTPRIKVDKKIREKNFCDFKEWTNDEEVREKISSYLLQDYAYCSSVTSREVGKLFNIDLKISKEVLDIHYLGRR